LCWSFIAQAWNSWQTLAAYLSLRILLLLRRVSNQTQSPNEFVLAARTAGIAIEVIPERRRFDLAVIPTLKDIVEQRQPDLIITHSVKSHFLMCARACGSNIRGLPFITAIRRPIKRCVFTIGSIAGHFTG